MLWIGTALSGVGFMMSMTAQSVVAFDLAGNNRAVGAVMFGQGIAMLALSPFGGAFADRLSKRLVLLLCQSAIGLSLFLTGVLIASGAITTFWLAASSFVMGTMFSFLGPARQAYVGEIVDAEHRGNAVAMSQVAMNLTRVVGPFIAGALLAWRLVGAAGTYFVMASIFVIVVATLLQLPPTRGRRRGEGVGVLREIALGVRHVTQNPRLLQLVAGFVVITLAGFPYMTVMPGYVTRVLGEGTGAYGILLGVSAVGGLVTSLFVAGLADSRRAPLVLTLSSAGLGIALILTGLAPSYAVALVTMFCVGGSVSGFQTLNNALALKETNPAFYGRVMSITMLAFSGTGLMALPIGLLADAIGERATLIAMGSTVCVIVALLALWGTRLRDAPAAGQHLAGARRPLPGGGDD